MAGFVSGGGGSFDYVQSGAPSNPQKGELWFDTDANSGSGEVKVYDGDTWNATGYVNHGELTNVTESQHHNPVTVSGPLTEDGTQGLGLSTGDGLAVSSGTLVAALGTGLGVDANGNIYIPSGAVTGTELSFDPATQTELNTHAGDATAHHSQPTPGSGLDANFNIKYSESSVSISAGSEASINVGIGASNVLGDVIYSANSLLGYGSGNGDLRVNYKSNSSTSGLYYNVAETTGSSSRTVHLRLIHL